MIPLLGTADRIRLPVSVQAVLVEPVDWGVIVFLALCVSCCWFALSTRVTQLLTLSLCISHFFTQ